MVHRTGAVEEQRMTDEGQVAGYVSAVPEPEPRRAPAAVPPASAPELKSLVALAVTAIVIAALYVAQAVLVPITLAVILSFVLAPLTNLWRRLGLWRTPSVVLSVLVALAIIGMLGTIIGSQAAQLAASAPQYAEAIEQKIEGVQAFATTRLEFVSTLIGRATHPAGAAGTTPGATATGEANSPAVEAPRPVLVELARPQSSAFTVARTILEPVMAPLETTVIVLVVAIFILLQKEDLRDRFIRLFGSSDLHRTTLALDDAGQRLSRFFISQFAVNTCFGLVISLGLWLIGVPSPALWGGLAGLLRFVPYIGPLIALVAPLALAAAVDPGWWSAAAVALLFIVVEPLTGYVVEPLLYGHSTGLSPASVIIAAVFWTWLWGPIGLILSTPLTLCLVVLGRHVRSLEFFDVLLGDRPPLSPVDTFYQRVLANNADEALENAEAALADRPLLDYYDTVVLPALKLAAADEERGKIDRERSLEMTHSMLGVIDELSEHLHGDHRVKPEPEIAVTPVPGIVTCIAGRGPFDDAVAAMLTQLLIERRVQSRRIPHKAVNREAIESLDLSSASVIVLSYLTLAGTPSRLRYLIRRLKERAPGATLIVGLWPEGDAILQDRSVQAVLGADVYVSSLRDAVAAAVTALNQPRTLVSTPEQQPAR
jgi:predicted PurR-regulated permease PerM